ncbi:MAG: FecR domain-containing protein, partial [Nannocystaceae bacterium]|nr:FecR domain-containing protein [Nannocystaceae bacterium]
MNDELERDDLDAWEVEPLGADFEDRVMAAWDAPSSREEPTRNRTSTWAAALSFAAAAALAVAMWPRSDGDAEDAIAIRAGASARVEYSPRSHRAEQTSGTVTYQVRSGTDFLVRTPAADITVHGTEFTVEILTMQDERRRKYLGAGALAMGGVAVAIYVSSGQVAVDNEYGEIALRPGGVAVASEYAAPRSDPAPVVADAKPAGTARTKLSATTREQVKRRLADALAERRAGSDVPEAEHHQDSGTAEPIGTLDKEYIREVVVEDLVPIAKECYESA